MSEKYYVVSESELQEHWRQGVLVGTVRGPRNLPGPRLAREACRAREVESIGGGMWQPADCAFEEEDV